MRLVFYFLLPLLACCHGKCRRKVYVHSTFYQSKGRHGGSTHWADHNTKTSENIWSVAYASGHISEYTRLFLYTYTSILTCLNKFSNHLPNTLIYVSSDWTFTLHNMLPCIKLSKNQQHGEWSCPFRACCTTGTEQQALVIILHTVYVRCPHSYLKRCGEREGHV